MIIIVNAGLFFREMEIITKRDKTNAIEILRKEAEICNMEWEKIDEKFDLSPQRGICPDISVIIPSWNSKPFLIECLQSLIAVTLFHRMEIIVVDNASTDGSPEATRGYFSNVKVIQNKANLGFAKANNIGIGQSMGRYLCLVNSDVKILAGCLDFLCDYMDEHPSIGIVGPKVLNPDMTVQRTCRRFPTLWSTFCCAIGLDKIFPKSYTFGGEARFFYPDDEISAVDVLSGCFLMVRREAIKQVGLLNEAFFFYGEDIDWCKRFRKAGWKIVFFPNAQAIHYGGISSSRVPVRFAIEQDRAIFQYWKEHHSHLSRSVLLCIIWLHHTIRIIWGIFSYFIKPPMRPRVVHEVIKHFSCIRWLLTSQIGNKQTVINDSEH